MPRKITETAISSAGKRAATSGQRVELTDAACPGLRLRITPKGARTWVLGMRDSTGALRRFALGSYSDELGIAKARQAAAAQRAKVKAGADPIAEARRKRALARDAKAGIGTLEALLDLYGAQQGRTRESWPECRRRIDSVFAQHLARPLESLRRTDLQLTADAWGSQSSASAAVRYIRPVLRWAAGRDLLTIDAANLSPPAVVKRRDRVLSRDELARLLPVLSASDDPYAAATLYILLTLARREEACSALWRDVDLKAATWTIPRTKNGQPHIVPLSHQAVALLATRGPGKPADGCSPTRWAAHWLIGTARPRPCRSRAPPQGGPATTYAGPARLCWASWARRRILSRRRSIMWQSGRRWPPLTTGRVTAPRSRRRCSASPTLWTESRAAVPS